MSQSLSDNSYRKSAFPFGLFLLAGGIVFSVMAFACPTHSMFLPPFEAETTKRVVSFAIAVYVFGMGVGFLKRRPWALYAFITYVALGTAWHVIVGLRDPTSRWLLYSPLINLPIGFAIFRVTRASFPRDD